MDIERQQSVGLIVIRPKKNTIRPKIRPFDDVPTENSPIERMSDTDIQSKPKENEICY